MRELSEDRLFQGKLQSREMWPASLCHLLLSEQIRGALNAAKKCEKSDPILVTHSSGNHGLAIATAAKLCGFGAHVVVAKTAPEVKQDAIRSMGAQITNCPTKSVQVCVCVCVCVY